MGPTVCELDGPIPILKISKMLVFKRFLRQRLTRACHRKRFYSIPNQAARLALTVNWQRVLGTPSPLPLLAQGIENTRLEETTRTKY